MDPETQRPFAIRNVQTKTLEEMTEEEKIKVAELRKQNAIQSKLVSECLTTILEFVKEHRDDDPFINGKLATENPYIKKKRCSIL